MEDELDQYNSIGTIEQGGARGETNQRGWKREKDERFVQRRSRRAEQSRAEEGGSRGR